METLLFVLILIAISFNWQSLKACVNASLAEASWKEIYKIALNIGIIIYLYGQVTK